MPFGWTSWAAWGGGDERAGGGESGGGESGGWTGSGAGGGTAEPVVCRHGRALLAYDDGSVMIQATGRDATSASLAAADEG